MKRLFLVGHLRGVPVYIHWTAFALAIAAAIGGRHRPAVTFFGIVSFGSVMLLHEFGHAAMARRVGTKVYAIELYPIHGITRFELPWSRFDECLIAWGGCLAQFAIAAPLVAWIVLVGYTQYEALNAVLALFGSYSMFIAGFNLLPFHPLDGSRAWHIVPLLWGRHVDTVKSKWERNGKERSNLTIVKRRSRGDDL
jgi:stage IV sporulation protein FB